MRFTAPLLAFCALLCLSLAACGGGSGALPAGEQPVIQASFGSATAGAALTGAETWDITIFNFSDAQILDMGLRDFGSSNAYIGGLSGHNPATFGLGQNGGAYWLTVPQGGYEIMIETDKGTLTVSGFTPIDTAPDGSRVPGPARVYLWGSDFQGTIPDPISRPRNPVPGIPVIPGVR
jgi:hypothetical protein